MSLLMDVLRHVHIPTFGATIFRKSYGQITAQGGLWDQSCKVYPLAGAQPRRSDLSWVFPSGARVKFAHMQHADTVLAYQGSELAAVLWDELTHFPESAFWYLFSRNRSMSGVRPYIRATCNPDADSWVAAMVDWWIDPNSGYPIPERAGAVRWFARINEELQWADSAEVLKEKYPLSIPKSFSFVPAKLEDNPALMAVNPDYLGSMLNLPLVERERLLAGNWKIRPAAGKVFNRTWFGLVDAIPAGGDCVRYWDLAATVKQLKGDDPDFTAGVRIRKVEGVFYVDDVIAVREAPADVEKLIKKVAAQDENACKDTGTRYQVGWEIEPSAGARYNSYHMTVMLAGIRTHPVSTSGKGDKVHRAGALSSQAEAGNVKVLKAEWTERFLREMHQFPDGPHDDIPDSCSGAFNQVNNIQPFRLNQY